MRSQKQPTPRKKIMKTVQIDEINYREIKKLARELGQELRNNYEKHNTNKQTNITKKRFFSIFLPGITRAFKDGYYERDSESP